MYCEGTLPPVCRALCREHVPVRYRYVAYPIVASSIVNFTYLALGSDLHGSAGGAASLPASNYGGKLYIVLVMGRRWISSQRRLLPQTSNSEKELDSPRKSALSALLRANGGTCQFWSFAKRLCIKKEANVPEEKARDVPIEKIEEAFSDKPERSRSRKSSIEAPAGHCQFKKLEENSSSVSAGRMAAADKSFFYLEWTQNALKAQKLMYGSVIRRSRVASSGEWAHPSTTGVGTVGCRWFIGLFIFAKIYIK